MLPLIRISNYHIPFLEVKGSDQFFYKKYITIIEYMNLSIICNQVHAVKFFKIGVLIILLNDICNSKPLNNL
jgi:hypothetical protein